MIDSLTIFTKGGLILYHSSPQQQASNGKKGTSSSAVPYEAADAINSLISTTLLDHNRLAKVRSSKRTALPPTSKSRATGGGGTVVAEWEESESDSGRDWIAVVLYPEVVLRRGTDATRWIRHLLRSSLREYALFYDVANKKTTGGETERSFVEVGPVTMLPPESGPFDATFQALLRRSEALGRRQAPVSTPGGGGAGDGELNGEGESSGEDDKIMDLPEGNGPEDDEGNDTEGPVDVQEGIARLKERAQRQQRGRKKTQIGADTDGSKPKKKGKEMTVWHDGTGKVTKSALKQLDMSRDGGGGGGKLDGIDAAVAEDSRALAEARAAYLPSTDEVPSWEEEDILNDDDESDVADGAQKSSGWGSSLMGMFDQMSGNKVLTDEDLDAPLADMERMLTSKNVANDIASEICDGVRVKLRGKRLQSFGRVKIAVRQALESAIEKVLRPAPDREVDMLKSIVTKRERGSGFFGSKKVGQTKPYVICMVGINGVGKSTSLAKIAYYLKSSGCRPLLAACDTFRSGAVEQLNVHAKCLDIPLYHKGYAKDPSAVARSAIDHAAEEGHDVVLVDTAGRMQNNVPLMKALSKLVVENQPDLVLFVCEALVGNDGMDQLFMFDKALRSGGHSRQIDGIVLTKFDTVSDKVGAALTMTHITGAPVVFVGTGQKYNHLKKLSTQSVIKSLFA